MLQILKLFFFAEKTKPWLVLTCLLLGGIAEAIGIGSVVPLVGTMMKEQDGTPSPLETYLRDFLSFLGLPATLEVLILLLTLTMLLRSALLFAANAYSGMAAARVTGELRRRLINAMFKARWNFYNDQSGGNIANELGNNASRAGDAYSYAAIVTSMLIQVIAYLAAAMMINWRVSIAGLVAGALIALAFSSLITTARKSGNKITTRVANFTSDMIDVLHNIKALKSMSRYEPIVERMAISLKLIERNLLRANAARVGLTYGTDAAIVVVIAIGAYLAYRFGHSTVPELAAYGILFYQVIYATNRLQKNLQLAILVESAYTSVKAMIVKAEAAEESSNATKAPELKQGCAFENVSFAHGAQPTVQNLNFSIPANQITVLQGPSGAGKTTIIDLLIGLHRPQTGTIRIGTDDLQDIDPKAWRSNIGYVPQELVLFHDTVAANVALYDEAITKEQIDYALAQAGATSFIKELSSGLETDVGEMGGKLSGGQKQRISLARALVKNPKIIILDEVTSALDPETEAEIVRNIKTLRGKYTIIAITHRPAWTEIADKLYKVEGGFISDITNPKSKKSSS